MEAASRGIAFAVVGFPEYNGSKKAKNSERGHPVRVSLKSDFSYISTSNIVDNIVETDNNDNEMGAVAETSTGIKSTQKIADASNGTSCKIMGGIKIPWQ